jgi:hypothetical protein
MNARRCLHGHGEQLLQPLASGWIEVAAGIDPVDLVAILQEFEGLQNNLGLPGVIAEVSMLRSQIVFETQPKLWGEVLFRSPKDIQVYPHLFRLAA